jgi:hypothetical protein
VFGIENEKVESSEREELGDTGGRPGEKAAEKGLSLEDAFAERAISFQLSALSFRRRDTSIRLISVTRF